jgi:hypothetical protein
VGFHRHKYGSLLINTLKLAFHVNPPVFAGTQDSVGTQKRDPPSSAKIQVGDREAAGAHPQTAALHIDVTHVTEASLKQKRNAVEL